MTTVNPGVPGRQRSDGSAVIDTAPGSSIAEAYVATHQSPQGDAPAADAALTMPVDAAGTVSPALLAAHEMVGHQRATGDTKVVVHASDDPAESAPRSRSSPTRVRC